MRQKFIFGRVFERAKYGQVGYPWKDFSKCSSDTVILGQSDPPVKSYEQISCLPNFAIVIIIGVGWQFKGKETYLGKMHFLA